MSLKRNITYLIIILLFWVGTADKAKAQQDPMYTQYMDNLLIINPGYAGTENLTNFMVVSRNQWVAFDGAPQTHTFSFNTPVRNQVVGLGFSILSDKIGPLTQTGLFMDYSYKIKLNEIYRLSMGLKGGFTFYRAALTELETVNPDPIYAQDIFKNFIPNFGVGAYLFSDDTYLGISVPKLVENTISREDYSSEYISKEKIHLYVIGGKRFDINEIVRLKGHSMLKFVANAPISLDLTVMAGLKEWFWIGAMSRFGDSWGLLAQVKATQNIMVGYSYDLGFSGLNAFNNGTHEIMLSYNLNLFK